MVPLLESAQMGRNHRADGSLIGRAIGQAADILENRADVEAGAAADAVQGIALLGVGQDTGAGVVHEDEVEFLRSIAFAFLPRTRIERVVARHRLAGAGGGQHREQDG